VPGPRAGPAPPPAVDREALVAEVLEALRAATRASEEDGRIVGLVGPIGVGRSALVERLLSDDRVLGEFPDGAVPVEFGVEPSPLAGQMRVVEALHERLHPVILDLAAGQRRVRQALAGHKALVVLDKIGCPEHLRAFPPPDGSVILAISDSAEHFPPGARLIRVQPPDSRAAASLLAGVAGLAGPRALPKEARALRRASGDRPVGLLVLGRHAGRDAAIWASLAARVSSVAASRVPPAGGDDGHAQPRRGVAARGTDQPHEARRRLAELCVFNWCCPVHESVVARLWRREGFGIDDTRELLTDLADRCLLQRAAAGAFRMHGLLLRHATVDLPAVGEPAGLAGLHARIADSYLADWGGLGNELRGLAEVDAFSPEERYGLRHLVSHLRGAGRMDEVHQLLRLPARDPGTATVVVGLWHQVSERAAEPVSFLADLAAAHRHAVDAGTAPGADTARMADYAMLEVRYLLMAALLDSGGRPSPRDLAGAAFMKIVDFRYALEHLRARSDDHSTSSALLWEFLTGFHQYTTGGEGG
jgi:hypothetical protein